MRIVCQLPTDNWNRAGTRAKWAEGIGYDSVTTSELAHDPFMPLAIAGHSTNRVALGTSIAVAFPPKPDDRRQYGVGFECADGWAV